jgi:hypothetical protein
MWPKQGFTAAANGHQRSAAVAQDLHQRPSAGARTVLPKLAVGIRLLTRSSGSAVAQREGRWGGP